MTIAGARRGAAALAVLLGFAGGASATPFIAEKGARLEAASLPKPLASVRFDQLVGAPLPPVPFRDHEGREVRLDGLASGRPLVLALTYARCDLLCPTTRTGLVKSLRALTLVPGQDFDVVNVSFDPAETPADAAASRAEILRGYGREGTDAGWHFLTGTEESIRALTEAVGFAYGWDEASKQFAHAAGVVVVTPDRRASRYLLGVEPSARDLRLALVEAADGKIGTFVDQALLFCFHYDPASGRYSLSILRTLRLLGVVTLAVLGVFVVRSLAREHRATRLRPVRSCP